MVEEVYCIDIGCLPPNRPVAIVRVGTYQKNRYLRVNIVSQNIVRYKIRDPLLPLSWLQAKLEVLKSRVLVEEVDFGHVALHKLFGAHDI